MKNIKTPGLAQHIREFICNYLPEGHPDITYTSLKFSTDRASISHVINNKEQLDKPTVYIGFEPHLVGSHLDNERNGFSIEGARGSTGGVPLGMGFDTPANISQQTYKDNNFLISTCDKQKNCMYMPFLAFHPRLDIDNIEHKIYNTPKKTEYMIAYMNRTTCPRREGMFAALVNAIGTDMCHSLGERCSSFPETKKPNNNPRSGNDSWYNDALYNTYSKYNFVLAMENTISPGYITEKIYNAYLAGAIPIYYGHSVVNDIFNPRSFINITDYPDFQSCANHISRMSTADIVQMKSEPIFRDNTLHDYINPRSVHYTRIISNINELINR
jgi:hypothetical protein